MGALYRIIAHYQQKEFVGQKPIGQEVEEEVGGDTVAEVLNAIWAKVVPWIKREVLVNGDSCSFAENENPGREEMGTFVILQDKAAKKNYSISQLTSDVLRKMRDKHISVMVHVYGKSVASKQIHTKVVAAILQPVDRDRAGAHSTVLLIELTKKLKEIHGRHLSGNTASWTMWANSIHAAPAHKQESMVSEIPPPHLVHLFRAVPIDENEVMRSAQNGLQIAGNLNDLFTENIKTLRQEFQIIRETLVTTLRLLDLYVRLKATEDNLEANKRLVDSMESALHVEENAVSLEEEKQITDLVDMDHN